MNFSSKVILLSSNIYLSVLIAADDFALCPRVFRLESAGILSASAQVNGGLPEVLVVGDGSHLSAFMSTSSRPQDDTETCYTANGLQP